MPRRNRQCKAKAGNAISVARANHWRRIRKGGGILRNLSRKSSAKMLLPRSANVRGNNSTYSLAAKAQAGFRGGRITWPEKQWWRSAWNGITAYIDKRIVTRREAMGMRLSEPIRNRFVALKEDICASWKSRALTAAWEDKRLLWALHLCDSSFYYNRCKLATIIFQVPRAAPFDYETGCPCSDWNIDVRCRKFSKLPENLPFWKKKKELIVVRTTLPVWNLK